MDTTSLTAILGSTRLTIKGFFTDHTPEDSGGLPQSIGIKARRHWQPPLNEQSS